MLCPCIRMILAASLGMVWIAAATAQDASKPRSPEAVAAEIDAHISKKLGKEKVPASPAAEDAEFLRRISLHLTGRLPAPERVLPFLQSADSDRRRKLIDELLASPYFGEHLSNQWAQLITAEEPKYRKDLGKWLTEEFNQNRPWSRIVSDLVTHEGGGPKMGFVMSNIDNNQPQPNKLAGSTSRLFLGVQLQCAECHNHPFTNWKQAEFWGMAAFFSRTRFQQGKGKEIPAGVIETTANPKGKNAPPARKGTFIVIPTTAGRNAGKAISAKFLEGSEPDLPDQGPVRARLAAWVTSPENKFFARAFVNRQWGQLFGRGIVHPVDDMHDENPAAHPEVLKLLAEEFKASGFDIKHLVRCICSTQAYQRTSRPLAENKSDGALASHMNVQVMSAEMLYDALTQAFGVAQVKIAAGPATSTTGRPVNAVAARDKFIKFFGTRDPDASPTEYTHGIPQALSLMNDPAFNNGGPTVEKLMKAHKEPEKIIEGLFLATLSRLPSGQETKVLLDYLARRPDPRQGYAGILWILINTDEFVLVR